jgi:hypothetical protein
MLIMIRRSLSEPGRGAHGGGQEDGTIRDKAWLAAGHPDLRVAAELEPQRSLAVQAAVDWMACEATAGPLGVNVGELACGSAGAAGGAA